MTKPLVVTIPHQLGRQEARRRLVTGLEQAKTAYAGKLAVVEDRWTDDRLDFRVSAVGQAVTGCLDVGDDQVTLALQLPWLLAVLADKASALIRKQGQLMLEKK